MWTIFSSVFNRLRLGCAKSSSESSVSSSFSLASEVSSASDLSGKLSPGKISCSFSSKHRLTVSPDTAISDPACQRRRGWEEKKGEERQCGKREWRQAGGRNGLKQEEEKEKEDTNLEPVNTGDGGLALAQLCTRDVLLTRPTVAPRSISTNFNKDGLVCFFKSDFSCLLSRLNVFFFFLISNRPVCSITFISRLYSKKHMRYTWSC